MIDGCGKIDRILIFRVAISIVAVNPRNQLSGEMINITGSTKHAYTSSGPHGRVLSLPTSVSCAMYRTTEALDTIDVSDEVEAVLGISKENFLDQRRRAWQGRLEGDDFDKLSSAARNLAVGESYCLLHRIYNDDGIPLWVANRIHKLELAGAKMLEGALIPLSREASMQRLDRAAVGKFIHKIGNHFQLLNLLVGSIRQNPNRASDLDLLQQTIERAVELTRVFSDYSQDSIWLSSVDMSDVLNTAIMTRSAKFSDKHVRLDDRAIDRYSDVRVAGDPFLLELAIGAVLENGLEASNPGETVAVRLDVLGADDKNSISKWVTVSIVDTGGGIANAEIKKIIEPFVTTKKDRDGLGLTLADRFIELHGGAITIKSVVGKGTSVEIKLPLVSEPLSTVSS